MISRVARLQSEVGMKDFVQDTFDHDLDGRNRARVIAESLARIVAAIRIASVYWWSYLPLKNTEFGPCRPCVRCAAIRIVRLAFVGVVFVPRGPAEWLARVDHVR